MSDIAGGLNPSLAERDGEPQRRLAFEAARRHSGRVRVLRRAIPLAAALAFAGLIGVLLFDPFRNLPGNVSVSRAGISGSRIVMDQPKLSGFRKDGRQYDVNASTAVQDVKKPDLIELHDLDARIGLADNGTAHITALNGTYDSGRDTMDLKDNVRLRTDAGYDVVLMSARIDLRAGDVVSNEPVSVAMKNATIAADSLRMENNGELIRFEGHVKSVFLPATPTPEQAPP
jgi:lipopolysaccharide export system protein LptC